MNLQILIAKWDSKTKSLFMAFSVNNHVTPNNHTTSGITHIVQAQEGPYIKYLNLIKSQHEAPGSRVEAAGPDSGLASVTARHS